MSDSKDTEVTKTRLEAMEQTGDGFKLAEIDLQLRGPGEFFWHRQSGTPDLKVAQLADTLPAARRAPGEAQKTLADDLKLEQPEHALLKAKVDAFWAEAAKAGERQVLPYDMSFTIQQAIRCDHSRCAGRAVPRHRRRREARRSDAAAGWHRDHLPSELRGDPAGGAAGRKPDYHARAHVLWPPRRHRLAQDDPVYAAKRQLIEQHNLVIWRFHDYLHSIPPDATMVGCCERPGWEAYDQGDFQCKIPPIDARGAGGASEGQAGRREHARGGR